MIDRERPTLLNPPAFRREVLPATIRGSTSRYGTSVEAPVLDVAGSLPQPVGSGTSRRRHVRMVRVALDVATDSRWSKSTTVRLALELEPINLEPCIVKVPVWIPCWSVARPIAEKSLFTVVQPPMTFLAGVKDLFYGRVAAASIFSDFSKKDLQPAL